MPVDTNIDIFKHAQRGRPYDAGGRDWADASVGKGAPRIAGSPRARKDAGNQP